MDIEIGSFWVWKYTLVEIDSINGNDICFYDAKGRYGEVEKDRFLREFKPQAEASKDDSANIVNHPLHYKDASETEFIEVTANMYFFEGKCFEYVYLAGSKGDFLKDLKNAAWYAERCWARHRSGNDRIHWFVKRKGEAIAHSREQQGQLVIAEVMRNIVNKRWWQVYNALLIEIEKLESEEVING